MFDMVLDTVHVVPDYDLFIMKAVQILLDITVNILNKTGTVLDEVKLDVVLVHGDTPTTFVTALAYLYKYIAIAHAKAELCTYNIHIHIPKNLTVKLYLSSPNITFLLPSFLRRILWTMARMRATFISLETRRFML